MAINLRTQIEALRDDREKLQAKHDQTAAGFQLLTDEITRLGKLVGELQTQVASGGGGGTSSGGVLRQTEQLNSGLTTINPNFSAAANSTSILVMEITMDTPGGNFVIWGPGILTGTPAGLNREDGAVNIVVFYSNGIDWCLLCNSISRQ